MTEVPNRPTFSAKIHNWRIELFGISTFSVNSYITSGGEYTFSNRIIQVQKLRYKLIQIVLLHQGMYSLSKCVI